MRLGRGQSWVPLKAEQWYTVHPPGFVWDCTLFAGPVPVVRARDLYRAGEGHMLVKAVSAFTVADAKGEELDQGEMMRYLNEMMWFPGVPWKATSRSTPWTPRRLEDSTTARRSAP